MCLRKQLSLSNLYGRSRIINGVQEFQLLKEHLYGTADLCMKFCSKFHAKIWGLYLGLFHDAGKVSSDFQQGRLGIGKNPVHLEHVDHGLFGAKFLFQKIGGQVGKILAFVICGHHGCLTNSLSGQSINYDGISLEERLKNPGPPIPALSLKEYEQIKISRLRLPKGNFKRFLFSKMLYSALVDADRLDSERYNDYSKHTLRHYDSIKILYQRMKKHLKNLSSTRHSKIAGIRTGIQKRCSSVAWSWWNPRTWVRNGFWTLTVPTGGGKTFGSAIFGLKYALRHGCDRVIVISSYTTILEQNAGELRKILGANNVLEHHCHFDRERVHYENRSRHFLAAENWESPFIFSTNVQFFESFYSAHSGRSRKLHNIINSVIILDEAHLLPGRLLKPAIQVLKELVEDYHCTVVFCTATQPGLLKQNKLIWGIDGAREIIKNPSSLYKSLERVRFEYRPKIKHDNQLAHLAHSFDQVMCIVNTRKHALLLYDDIYRNGNAYHLSTLMCAMHRKQVIEKIQDDLSVGKKCRVVTTQLVECGVDLDFPVVVRNRCGIASIIQSAGRCNREGHLSRGLLIVSDVPHDFDDDFAREAENIAIRYLKQGRDLLGPDVAQEAFIELYKNLENSLDKKRVLKLIQDSGSEIPFFEIARRFKIIENSEVSIIVPYDERARNLVVQLRETPDDFSIARALQSYTVQIYPKEMEKIHYAINFEVEPYLILADVSLYDGPSGANPGTGLRIFNSGDLGKYRT
ncbi:MAG: CRISPR-associated helicase Cas3' [Bacteroidales bacterium]